MNSFETKCKIADVLDKLGISSVCLHLLNKKYKNNYIRIVNYHFSPLNEQEMLTKQIQWFLRHYENCDFDKLKKFLNGNYIFEKKPGIIFTFDDGFKENYEVAHPILLGEKATGWYMVSAGLIGAKSHQSENGCHDYMDIHDLKSIIREQGVVACHTFTHHRMNSNDTKETLIHEIVDAKKVLETCLDTNIDIFCWCGGEEQTYTREAAETIKQAGYQMGFMTNSCVVTPKSSRMQLDRINIESSWPLSLVKFQVCGIMDWRFKGKRKRVHKLTGGI